MKDSLPVRWPNFLGYNTTVLCSTKTTHCQDRLI